MACIATFDVTSMALLFEKYCRAEGLPVRVVPVPRKLSSSCGFACSYPCEAIDQIRRICEEKRIDVVGYHEL